MASRDMWMVPSLLTGRFRSDKPKLLNRVLTDYERTLRAREAATARLDHVTRLIVNADHSIM